MADISFLKDGEHIHIVVDCHASTKQLTEASVRNAFEKSDYYNAYLIADEIHNLLKECNQYIDDIQIGQEEAGEFTHKIGHIKDGAVTITVAPDKMSARAKIEMAWGGKDVTLKTIKRACLDSGVVFGVKKSKVERLLEKTLEGLPGDIFEDTIAIGKDPKHGKNAYFKPLVELFSAKLRAPTEVEGGKVDLKDLGEIETVKPGEKIFQKFPLTEGVPGKNVLGEWIPAVPGKDMQLEVSEGTKVDENDKNVLLAKQEGIARLIENRMEVDDVYMLPELTPKHGHIKFNGTVIIAGDVLPEMKVIATGDVIIGGYVESASIRCRGEITVMSGVSGKALENPTDTRKFNCLLESGNRVNIGFANQVDIIAKRDVQVQKQMTHCNVIAASLKVGQGEVPNGKLAGGHYQLSKFLDVGKLGAPSDAETIISLNRTFSVFKEKEDAIWQKIEPLIENTEKLKKKLKSILDDNQKSEIKKELVHLQRIIDKQSRIRKTLIQRRRDYMAEVKVRVNHTMFGGLTYEIGDKSKSNERERGPSIVRLDEYQLVIEPKS